MQNSNSLEVGIQNSFNQWTSKWSIVIYSILFCIFSFRVVPDDLILILALLVIIASPFEEASLLYAFSFIWCDVAIFSFGVTYSLVVSGIFCIKSVFHNNGKVNLSRFDLIIIFYLSIVAIISGVFNSSLTAIGIVLYYYNARELTYQLKEKTNFAYKFFLVLMISTLIGIVYGFFGGTAIERWVAGYGSIFQMYGTLGTTRFAIYLCSSMIFPLYYVNNKAWKYILFTILSVSLFLTISITGVIIYIALLIYYAFTGTNNKIKILVFTFTIVVVLAAIILNWNSLLNSGFFKPILLRINSVVTNFKSGNYDAALSGRNDLGSVYIDYINNSSIIRQLFGSGEVALITNNYSHNTYLDLIQFYGYVGLIGFVVIMVKRIYDFRQSNEFVKVLLFKLILLSSALTVSIFTAFYWQVPVLL